MREVYFYFNNCLFQDIGTRIPYIEHYYKILKYNVILIAYRGYSDSSGEPSEAGL